ncbi:AbrB family transcriptional regulator [Candidatus Pacearchaeota archaeon CG10_big_fil_rev_8_21_14_0_10_32_14]|nr:MAG: AbrB family transcriptional regulator [Candidatus Pacearchaeota archaeon CG10_big_fil_rev_8_21_14_0_10_32_14]
MEKIEITSVSSRGQIVIPQNLREKLRIKEGEKFIVIGEDNTLVLKRIEMSSFKGYEKLLKKTREYAKKQSLEEKEIAEAISKARKK